MELDVRLAPSNMVLLGFKVDIDFYHRAQKGNTSELVERLSASKFNSAFTLILRKTFIWLLAHMYSFHGFQKNLGCTLNIPNTLSPTISLRDTWFLFGLYGVLSGP